MLYLIFMYGLLLVVFTALHLYGSYHKRDGLRGPTKVVILLAILGMYLEWTRYNGSDPSALLVFALVTSWLGDVLLIPKGVKWFTAGGILFWISHFLFIFAYVESGIVFSKLNPVVVAAIAVVYAAVVVFLFGKLRDHLPKAIYYPMFFYLLTNGAMNVFAWLRLLSGSCTPLGGVLTGFGALLFFISDSSLFFVRFHKNSRLKTHFIVMLTYIIGEFLIVLGLMFI